MTNTHQSDTTVDLTRKYAELARLAKLPASPDYADSLEQPTFLKIVDSVTTYGAYENPI